MSKKRGGEMITMKTAHRARAQTRAEHFPAARAPECDRIKFAGRTADEILICRRADANERFGFDGFRQNILKLFAVDFDFFHFSFSILNFKSIVICYVYNSNLIVKIQIKRYEKNKRPRTETLEKLICRRAFLSCNSLRVFPTAAICRQCLDTGKSAGKPEATRDVQCQPVKCFKRATRTGERSAAIMCEL